MKQSEAIHLVAKLAAFYPYTPEDSVVAYASKILDLDAGAVDKAIDVLIETCDRFPSLHQVREAVKTTGPYRFGVHGGPALPAGEWSEEDEAKAREAQAKVMAEYRARRCQRGTVAGAISDERPARQPVELSEPAGIIEERRRKAREAKRALLAEAAADQEGTG